MWLYGMTALVFAQEVQLKIDSNQVSAGIPTVLTVLATGFEEDPTPEIGTWSIQGRNRDSVQVDFLGVEPMVSRQTSIINGRRTDSVNVRYAYQYRLLVQEPGNYQIPTIQVTQGDVSATSRPGQFSVTEVPTTPDMAIELNIPTETVWVGQTIPLNIDLYLQRDIGDLTVVVPLFDQFPVQSIEADRGTPLYTISTVHGDIQLPYTQERVRRNNQEYTRVRMMAETTLNQAGNITVPPTRVLAQMVVGQQRGMLGFSRAQYQLFQAKDQSKTLDVRPLPLKDKPDSFSGAVGEAFSMSIRANKTVVAVGEPIPLEIEVRGKGSLEGIQLPEFEALGFDDRIFETPKQAPLGIDNDQGGKIFSFSVRLKSADVREIPTLDFGYFDPTKKMYQHAYTQPIALSVSGSKVVSASQVVSNTVAENQTTSTSVEGSLSTSAFDLSWYSGDSSGMSTLPWFELSLGIHGLALLGWFGIGWRERTKESRAERSSKKSSAQVLNKVLTRVSDVPAAEVASDLTNALRTYGQEHQVDIQEVVRQIEIESYAPSAKTKPFSDSLRQQIQTLLLVLFCCLSVTSPRVWADETSSFEETYRNAMSLTVHSEQRSAMLALQKELEAAVANHPDDIASWINLGTVSVQVSDRGQAVWAYTQVERLGAQSAQVQTNLQQIEAQLPSWAGKANNTMWQDILLWTTLPNWMQWAGLNLLGVVCLLGWRRWAGVRWLLVPWLALALGLSLIWLEGQEPLVVVVESVPLRTADHLQAPPVRNDWLPTGARFLVVQSQSDWVQIELPSGVQGWLPISSVRHL